MVQQAVVAFIEISEPVVSRGADVAGDAGGLAVGVEVVAAGGAVVAGTGESAWVATTRLAELLAVE
jgi:hypothetical protein